MAHHNEGSTASGPAAVSRREAGPAPDFALVRPYVASLGDEPAEAQPGFDQPIASHRRPGRRSKVSLDPPDATAEFPLPRLRSDRWRGAPAAAANSRRWSRVVPLAMIAGVVVALAIVGAYLFRAPADRPTTTAFAPVPATVPTFPPAADTSTGPSLSPTPTTVRSTKAASAPHSPVSPRAATPTSLAPRALLPTSPVATAVTATGAITAGDLCVDDNGAGTANGNAIQLFGCNRSSAQVWAFAADGTVRAVGKCMHVTKPARGGLVELWDCDGSAGEVWRAGRSGSLVNVASGLCLDAPGWRRDAGTRLAIERCTGARGQRWTMP